jgi:dihydroflavonol-4-reductase
VEAAAAEGISRVVITSTISAIGTADEGPADEDADYPDEGLGLTYADAKHQGEEEALEAGRGFGVEVVVVNPAYVLGVPVDDSQPGETSTRTVGGYLRGRLPAVIDAPMNFVDVEDAAVGHLLAAERGAPGERYILGGHNVGWVEFIDRIADISGVHHPMLVLPAEVARVARLRETLRLPGIMAAEGLELMSKDWRFSSEKAQSALGYQPRPLDETLRATVEWYQRLIEEGAFDDEEASGLSRASDALRTLERLGLLTGLRVAQRVAGRRLVAGK